MAATELPAGTGGDRTNPAGGPGRRLATEAKQAFKTTEFWAFVVIVIAILISAAVIKGGDTGKHATDEFVARQAWLYVAIVTSAYLISRGLAKSGSREPYHDDGTDAHQRSHEDSPRR